VLWQLLESKGTPLAVKQHCKFLILLIYALWMFSCDPEFLEPNLTGKREDVLIRWLYSFQRKASIKIKLQIISRGDLKSNSINRHNRIQFNQ